MPDVRKKERQKAKNSGYRVLYGGEELKITKKQLKALLEVADIMSVVVDEEKVLFLCEEEKVDRLLDLLRITNP